jgi:hypothetical protein
LETIDIDPTSTLPEIYIDHTYSLPELYIDPQPSPTDSNFTRVGVESGANSARQSKRNSKPLISTYQYGVPQQVEQQSHAETMKEDEHHYLKQLHYMG